MKTIEVNHNNDWRDKLLNSWPFLLDTEQIRTAFAFVYCRLSGQIVRLTDLDTDMSTSLFQNGTVFMRYTVTPLTPFVLFSGLMLGILFSWWFFVLIAYGIFVQVSWKETGNKRYFQGGFGHKLNGRIGLPFRIPKNDEQAAKGTNGPNFGQSKGWDCGTK